MLITHTIPVILHGVRAGSIPQFFLSLLLFFMMNSTFNASCCQTATHNQDKRFEYDH